MRDDYFMGSKKNIILLRLLVFTLPFILFSCVDEQLVNDPGPNTAGSIYLQSVPSGARIYFLGTDIGKVTPDSVVDLNDGNYEVTLRLQDYKDTTFTVSVISEYRTTKNIVMKSARANGTVIVLSNPSGAQIFLNGVNSSKTTPDTLKNLDAGTYSLTLKLQGYIDTTFSVNVADNVPVRQNVSLNRIPPVRKASLGISSQPNGAQIFLNGTNTGKLTPDSLTNLDNGTYSITLKNSGYYDTTFSVNITNNSRYDRAVNLSRIRKGSIFIRSNPTGAQIFLNGVNSGKRTPDTLTELNDGSYSVTLRETGYHDTTFTVILANNQNVVKDVSLRKIILKNTITVQSEPPGAQIYLAGNNTGKVTPDNLTNLSDGTYNIRLSLAGFADTSFSVTVSNGITETVTIKLRDTLPAIDVKVEYQVTFLKQLIFTFYFNQDVLLDNVEITDPDEETTTLNYNGMLIKKDERKGILILRSEKGDWDLTFNGRKAGGAQDNFSVTKEVKVKD